MFDLSGKTALVTGASRGIGKGIALCLAKQGVDVVVNFRSKEDEAQEVVKGIEAMGRKAITAQADVSRKEDVERMVQEIITKLGKIDILVNNAGIYSSAKFLEMTEEEWDRTININLKSQFLVAQAVAKEMIRRGKGGRIINISSVASGQVGVGIAQGSHYAASKAGIIALTESLGIELAPYNINVNAIAPGLIETDMTKAFTTDPKVLESFLARIPKKRVGTPEDIGYMAVFLSSDEADYCTGATFYVDGGWLAG